MDKAGERDAYLRKYSNIDDDTRDKKDVLVSLRIFKFNLCGGEGEREQAFILTIKSN